MFQIVFRLELLIALNRVSVQASPRRVCGAQVTRIMQGASGSVPIGRFVGKSRWSGDSVGSVEKVFFEEVFQEFVNASEGECFASKLQAAT